MKRAWIAAAFTLALSASSLVGCTPEGNGEDSEVDSSTYSAASPTTTAPLIANEDDLRLWNVVVGEAEDCVETLFGCVGLLEYECSPYLQIALDSIDSDYDEYLLALEEASAFLWTVEHDLGRAIGDLHEIELTLKEILDVSLQPELRMVDRRAVGVYQIIGELNVVMNSDLSRSDKVYWLKRFRDDLQYYAEHLDEDVEALQAVIPEQLDPPLW